MDEKKAKKDLFWETGLFLTQVLAVSIAVAAVIGFGHAEPLHRFLGDLNPTV